MFTSVPTDKLHVVAKGHQVVLKPSRRHAGIQLMRFRYFSGFLPPMESGGRGANNGLLDIVAALHWVQENVIEFGGDPGNVTVFGHGRGAALANLIMLTPMARGENVGVICMTSSRVASSCLRRCPRLAETPKVGTLRIVRLLLPRYKLDH